MWTRLGLSIDREWISGNFLDKLWIWGGQNLGIEDKVWTNLRQGQSFDKMWTCLGQKLDKIWTWTKFGHNLVDLHCQ